MRLNSLLIFYDQWDTHLGWVYFSMYSSCLFHHDGIVVRYIYTINKMT